MPCYDPENYDAEKANEKVQELTAFLCEVCGFLDAHGLLKERSVQLQMWWHDHKKTDEALARGELFKVTDAETGEVKYVGPSYYEVDPETGEVRGKK